MDIPSTDVIRHWVAWTYLPDTPEEYVDHDYSRVELFNEWLESVRSSWYAQGVLDGRDYEREQQRKRIKALDITAEKVTNSEEWEQFSAYRGIGGMTWYDGKADDLGLEFDRWLKLVKAEAWKEGADNGCMCQPPKVPNPYKGERE